MRLPFDEDIKDFEIRVCRGILKGIAERLGKGYEYVRQQLKDSDKRSWYEDFYRFWLAVDAENQSVADAYFFDFQARRAARRNEKPEAQERDLIASAVRASAAGIDAAIHKDVARMEREIPDAMANLEELLVNARKERDLEVSLKAQ